MCGIVGIFHYAEPDRPVDRDLLVRMTRILAHRGPDAEGFHIDGPLGFGHRRLSIVDLSPTGAQPMSNEDGTCWITYNGEFYNHASFRERLLAQGHRFRGSSDTETMLHLMEETGPEALADVAGIFGFAFWNSRTCRLTLARDPLGVKQIYYHDDGRRIVFASEIKALLLCLNVPRDPDLEGINQYLHFHTALFERTFFRGISQLRAGEYLEIGRFGAKLRSYWSVRDFTRSGETPEQLIEELRNQLGDVVKDQLMSDVPVGSFFSGGIDSSAVAAYASRGGKSPVCFGVHFTEQGVIDERPYQETAARALGLDLQLITMNGSSFPDDMTRLMYHQDEPVIGAAMFPMFYVSQLAASQVKVCLGGQGADEIFGGYARYALGRPSQVIQSWFTGRRGQAKHNGRATDVGGNLRRQFSDTHTIYRLLRNTGNLINWEKSYFENFAKVPEASWAQVFQSPDFYCRERCRQLFHEIVNRSPAKDPADKVMHWDTQTYLTGLFHQDDRMSMAVSLESRVPLADPRLVRFAFRTGFDMKFRGGASKWILRQAVSDILPQSVLTRRKVGFDTPVESWIKEQHSGFVRDMLLSKHARQRGFWNSATIETLLSHQGASGWFDIVWKILSIEVWASIFLDGSFSGASIPNAPYVLKNPMNPAGMAAKRIPLEVGLRELWQEGRELGVKKTLARSSWELKTRSGLASISNTNTNTNTNTNVVFRAIFSEPSVVANAVRPLLLPDSLSDLVFQATEATRGRILCFGKWMSDFGNPIDWHCNSLNHNRWPADAHWSRVLADETRVGDVKLSWEVGRFPQAYSMARCAAFFPETALDLSSTFLSQVRGFLECNPVGQGIHWNSGQEIALRLMSWLFAFNVFFHDGTIPVDFKTELGRHLFDCGVHIAHHIEYARDSVYNNHLLSEALALYAAGRILPGSSSASAWVLEGRRLLEQEANHQFYPDGAYIQQSHNYHRFAIQIYLWAIDFAKSYSDPIPPDWLYALERSLDFLLAHQNPLDGRLPNYGANDGAIPLPLSSCDFSDFRPTLQTASIMTRQERVFHRGPWDEMAVWFCGSSALDLPLRKARRTSVSFSHTGYHVLRGHQPENFAAFRCGTILDRFSQIDMLHLDVWWRGHNVLVDPGSYLYNGPEKWHDHFLCTGSHNTVQVDNRDQMLHYRKFKCLYWTRAKLLRFEDNADWALCEGEHYGYQRHKGRCIHRRSVLFLKDDLWIVVDRVEGKGAHRVRLHWLGGDFPYRPGLDGEPSLQLETPDGSFYVSVYNAVGNPLSGEIVAGQDDPPRGWLSRYYGEKVTVPSLTVEPSQRLPITMVSILGPHAPSVSVSASLWSVMVGDRILEFELNLNGTIQPRSSTPVLLPS
ncbi:MAG: asparagine synthase (glutamine-hydrolyzing) [Terracidiphilus sp.]